MHRMRDLVLVLIHNRFQCFNIPKFDKKKYDEQILRKRIMKEFVLSQVKN